MRSAGGVDDHDDKADVRRAIEERDGYGVARVGRHRRRRDGERFRLGGQRREHRRSPTRTGTGFRFRVASSGSAVTSSGE